MAQAIVFYISGHGFGHASRTIEVINAILVQRPETRVGVRTSAPRWLFDLTVKGKVTYSTLECDTGVVQVDALTLDEADSIRRAQSFHSDMVTRAASETRALRELGAGLIVGDIPPLAFAVGASAGIPSIGLGNFTWDWVYADYPRVRLAPSLLPTIRGAYAKASMALRLPMSGGFESFSNVRDIPFVARHASRSREEVCKTLKIPGDKPVVLASFGGYGLTALDTDVLSKFKKYTVITTVTASLTRGRRDAPATEKKGSVISINEESMYGTGIRYEDLVGTADAVVTKPGYGIVSECAANDTPLLYTSRGRFREYDLFVAEMPQMLRCRFISQDDLLAGRWTTAVDALRRRAGPAKNSSGIGRRECSWRRFRSSLATGRTSTTGAGVRRD